MNKKTFILAVIVPFIGMTSLASADFDCSTVERETLKTIMDKQKAGTTLTAEETTLLANAKTCAPKGNKQRGGSGALMPQGGKFGSGGTVPNMTDEQKAQFEAVKAILEKKKAGTTLTSEEEATLATRETNKPLGQEKRAGTGSVNQNDTKKETKSNIGLKQAHKTLIDKKVKSIVEKFSSYEESEKIEKLGAFKEKIEVAKTKVENLSSLTSAKKETYVNLLAYMIEQLQEQIDALNNTDSTEEVDALLNDVFN